MTTIHSKFLRLPIYLLFAFIILTSVSCRNKEQEKLLVESVQRLEQQNNCIRNEIQTLRGSLHTLMNEEFKARNIIYLEKIAESFYHSSDSFSEEIKKVKIRNEQLDEMKLFGKYNLVTSSYQNFRSSIKDSFSTLLNKLDTNKFINMDQNQFRHKYFEVSTPSNTRFQILILEADALLNELTFLKDVVDAFSPYCNFGQNFEQGIAFTDKCLYKKGDSLRIIAMVANYARYFNGGSTIEGKKIMAKDGLVEYNRIITETPGVYWVHIDLTWQDNKNITRTIPTIVSFKVE